MTKVIYALAAGIPWAILAVLLVATIVPADIRPIIIRSRYIEHFIAFSALGAAFGTAYGRQLTIVAIGLTVFVVSLEMAQEILPTRHARWQDLIVNALAVYAGIGVSRFTSRHVTDGCLRRRALGSADGVSKRG